MWIESQISMDLLATYSIAACARPVRTFVQFDASIAVERLMALYQADRMNPSTLELIRICLLLIGC